MKLKRLTLDNYGLYRGTTTFDLAPKLRNGKNRPVVLFGGQNGAGKTTLFDAFRVILYGKTALGDRVSDADYKSFLNSRIHRCATDVLQVRSAYLELEFEHVPLGVPITYIVRRSWERSNGKGVTEHLSISEDDKPLDQVSQEYWKGFIEEIIPERLSSLFFFDGEKIKSIADDNDGNTALAESIKTLLGLDIVERLHSDLTIYKTREALKHSPKDYQAEIGNLKNAIDNNTEVLETISQNLAANQNKIDLIEKELKGVEQQLKQEGYAFSLERDTLNAQKGQIKRDLEVAQAALRAEYEGAYPFALCPNLNQQLRVQIAEEQNQQKGSIIREELIALQQSLTEALMPQQAQSIDNNNPVTTTIQSTINARLTELTPPADYVELHCLSPIDAAQVLRWLDKAEKESQPKVASLQAHIEDLTRQLQKVEQDLLKAPAESILKPIFEQQNQLNQSKGGLTHERERLQTQERTVRFKLAEETRALEKVVAKKTANKDAGNRVAQSTEIQKAITVYADKLTKAKIEELRTTVAKCFNMLSRKGDVIKSIHIDPSTFAVTLHDRFGNILPKDELSAGEKQMYAVAMLWGLSLTSGRPLPVIIDTPLGRLDSVHRRKLICNYFPKAAEQVIILSTDTEIDQQWYSELKPSLSHCYQLTSLPEENRTQIEHGYFWENN